MALHRDIHWIGRQWAVTGHGMQLIDQKLQGFFDIEADRLWDENLIAGMQAKEWLNRGDFDKGLEVARARFPKAPPRVTPLPEVAPLPPPAPVAPPPPVAKVEAPKRETPKFEPPAPVETRTIAAPPEPETAARVSSDPPIPPSPDYHMRFTGGARFVRPWRVWVKRQIT